jgi:hypothetical protein
MHVGNKMKGELEMGNSSPSSLPAKEEIGLWSAETILTQSIFW